MGRDWKFVKLKDVCQVVTGSTPKTNIPEYWDGEYPWVTPAELKGEKYIQDTERHITDEAVAHTNLTLMPVGTVLLSSRAPIGKVAITETEMYCNQGFKNLICSDKIDNQYLYLWLSSQTEYLNSLGRGATFKEISKTIVENIELPLTSLEKQRKIVAELEQIKSLLSLKYKQLDIYDKLAQSIFYEMFGDPVTNEKGWEVKKFGDICDVRDGTHDSPQYLQDSPYVLITSKNIVNGEIDFNNINYISEEDYISINKRSQVDEGDIIMAMIGTIGKPIIVKSYDFKFCIKNVALIKFTQESVVSNIYIQSLLSNSLFMTYIESLNKGGTQKFIALGTIRKLNIPVPPVELQQEYNNRINALNRQKNNVKVAIEKLETLLNSRMDYWFVIQPVAEQIVENAMTEDNIKEIYYEYKQGKDIQDGTIHYDNGHPYGCTDNNMDFRLLADIYNYMKDSGETSLESIEGRYSYTSHAKECVLELKELGLLSSDDLKTFHIV